MKHPRRDETEPRAGALARNMFYSLVGSLAYQGCLWLTTVLVVLLAKDYEFSGILAFAMATGNMFFALGTYNMRTFQVSDVQQAYQAREYVGFRVATIALSWAIMIPYTLVAASSKSIALMTFLFLLFKTDECLSDVLYGVDQKAERMDLVGISQFLRGILVVVGFAGVLWKSGSLALSLLAMVVAGVCMTLLFDIPMSRKIATIRPRVSVDTVKALLKTCLPVAAAPLLTSMVVAVPRQCFSWMYGLDALGVYAAVATPAVLIQAAARYLYQPLLVPLSEVWERRGRRAYIRKITKILAIMCVIAVVVIACLTAVGTRILPLVFGKEISENLYLFAPVLCSTALIAIFWFLTDALVICRDMAAQLIASGAAFCCAACTMHPLEGLFYMNGINATVIISMFVGNIVAFYLLARRCSSYSDVFSQR